MSENAKPKVGTVYLVGAGPGDPGLLTVRGRDLLATADVVVYDQLASDKVVAMARVGAERIYVGKKAGRHSLPQEKINVLLAEKALAGKSVVRLKGGDPFVFGRGGEEALVLVERGVPFEVVPGVTAATAVPAYAGIPVTHRGYTATLGLVTGHEDPTKDSSDIDWKTLAEMGTLVFYMGVKNLPVICGKLIEHGRGEGTPAALIREGTLPSQRTLVGTLATLPGLAVEAGFKPPSLIVVGEVVQLRDQLRWIEDRPLHGKRIVVTRTREQASDLVKLLEGLGAEVVEFSTIRIDPPADPQPLRHAIRHLRGFDWVVFTSVNGVESFFRELHLQGHDARHLAGVKACAIGPATSLKLAEQGVAADLMPEKFVAEAVLDAMTAKENLTGKRVLLPRADLARETLPEGLRAAGAVVEEVDAYRTVVDDRSAGEVPEKIEGGQVDMVTFTSSSTVTNFCALLGPERVERLKGMVALASIGPVTTETIRAHGLAADVSAEVHTIPGLVDAIAAYYGRGR
jgi:uroporphyrinogen III methyltransferase/synthase